MQGLMIILYAETASFRDPNTHLYQETLPAPSPTNIVGMVGAALGISFKESLEFFKNNRIGIGYSANREGFGKDLWSYSKIKSGKVGADILIREFFFGINAELFLACEDRVLINQLQNAFKDPSYALTLGNSDELVKIISTEIIEDIVFCEEDKIVNTWIVGNHIRDFKLDWDYIKSTPIKMTIKPPIVKNLPIDFKFNENDEREATKFEKFTFFEEAHVLNSVLGVYKFKNRNVPLFIFDK
ncbi:MAG: CRISPR-associated protein Cas5 [Peptococcales bacterium]|jgi:CRISPR-associated protein Cas5t